MLQVNPNGSVQQMEEKNAVLPKGVIGIAFGATPAETIIKVGDGVHPWNSLPKYGDVSTELEAKLPMADFEAFLTVLNGRFEGGSITMSVNEETGAREFEFVEDVDEPQSGGDDNPTGGEGTGGEGTGGEGTGGESSGSDEPQSGGTGGDEPQSGGTGGDDNNNPEENNPTDE